MWLAWSEADPVLSARLLRSNIWSSDPAPTQEVAEDDGEAPTNVEEIVLVVEVIEEQEMLDDDDDDTMVFVVIGEEEWSKFLQLFVVVVLDVGVVVVPTCEEAVAAVVGVWTRAGEAGRELLVVTTFFGVLTPPVLRAVPEEPRSRLGYWILRRSRRDSFTHSSKRLLSAHKSLKLQKKIP